MNNVIPLKRSDKIISKLQGVKIFPLCVCYNCGKVALKFRMSKGVCAWGIEKPVYACDDVCRMAIILRHRRENEARWRRFILGIGAGIGV
ncbi:MAG: hypothetical protein E5Y74_00040 [Mesorhizobium sp.]|nr:MAG: hypothetical protein E5Y74_00040 [Mesorhizobium sp.]